MFSFWKSAKGDDTTTPTTPTIPGGTELYDMLMSAIEPDLVSTQVDTLDEKYIKETKEQRTQRMERYKKAFHAYVKAYEQYQVEQASAIRSFGKKLVAQVEEEANKNEEHELHDLESAISNS